MYCFEVAHDMYVQAACLCLDADSSDSAQAHSQPELCVLSTGAGANPSLPATGLVFGSSTTEAPTVASYHIADLLCSRLLAHSLKLASAAPASPAALMRSV